MALSGKKRVLFEFPLRPGEMLLKEFLVPMQLTQKDFTQYLGWTYARLNEIIKGKRGVSADSALAFADAFQMEPEFWLNLQNHWDLWQALQTYQHKLPLTKKAA